MTSVVTRSILAFLRDEEQGIHEEAVRSQQAFHIAWALRSASAPYWRGLKPRGRGGGRDQGKLGVGGCRMANYGFNYE